MLKNHQYVGLNEILLEIDAGAPESDNNARRRRMKQFIKDVLYNELTDKQRTVIAGVFYDGKSQLELAQELGVTPAAICRTKQRALSKIKRFARYTGALS